MKRMGIVVFDGAELLDFCGPYEVFSIASRVAPQPLYELCLIGEKERVTTHNGLVVVTDNQLDSVPTLDILLVPGGQGVRQEVKNTRLVQWIGERAEAAELVLSVCTGAALLGRAGVTRGMPIATHHSAYDFVGEMAPGSEIREERYVDNGKYVFSAGISAGTDMAFYIVERFQNRDLAIQTARHMEYDWQPN